MTEKQKREIVQRFKRGEFLTAIVNDMQQREPYIYQFALVEDVLRDYMNGKFTCGLPSLVGPGPKLDESGGHSTQFAGEECGE